MNVIRAMAFILGLILIIAGVLGFVPAFVKDGLLFGFFEIDEMHNIVHLVSGALALLASASTPYSQLYFQVLGIFYGIVTILGFVFSGNLLFMHVNFADNLLHLAIAAFAIFFGFVFKIDYSSRY
jgi:hypothetical protein